MDVAVWGAIAKVAKKILEVLIGDLESGALERLMEKAAEADNWELIELIEEQM